MGSKRVVAGAVLACVAVACAVVVYNVSKHTLPNAVAPVRTLSAPDFHVRLATEEDLRQISKGVQPLPDFVPAGDEELDRVQRVVADEKRKYLPGFVEKSTIAILVCKSFKSEGVNFAGTQDYLRVWLMTESSTTGRKIPDDYIAGVFHHEFASVIFNRFMDKPSAESWLSAVDKQKMPRGGPIQAAKIGQGSTAANRELWPAGFFADYSMSSFEKDFSVLWEACYSTPQQVVEAASSSPVILHKLKILRSTLRKAGGGDLPPQIIDGLQLE